MIEITAHGHRRMKQRCGKSMDRLATIAFERGLCLSETSGSLRRYITSLYLFNCTADNIRLYGDKVYIFSGEILITVLDTPREYRETVRRLMEKKKLKSF